MINDLVLLQKQLDYKYALLAQFKHDMGHCNVGYRYTIEDNRIKLQ